MHEDITEGLIIEVTSEVILVKISVGILLEIPQ